MNLVSKEAANIDETVPGLSKELATLGKKIKEYNAAKGDLASNYFRLVKLHESANLLYNKASATCKIPGVETWLANEKSALEGSRWEFAARFGKSLANRLEPQFTLGGTYPEFRAGFFTIEISEKQGTNTIWYGNKEEKLRTVQSIDVDSLIRELHAEYQRITRQRFTSTEQFLSGVWDSYKIVVNDRQLTLGSPVELIRVLKELNVARQGQKFWDDPRAREFRAYTREEFSYDLSKLIDSNRSIEGRAVQLSVATREQNRDRGRYLWIPIGGSQGTIYSMISFRSGDSVTS